MIFSFISTMAGSPWGGSEELWSQAALRLRSEGHVIAASVAWWPQLSGKVTALSDHGAELFVRKPVLNSNRLAARFWRRVRRQFQPTQSREHQWLQWLCQQQPDLVVISQGGNIDGYDWMQFCQEAGLPFVAIMHANHESWWPTDQNGRTWLAAYRAARKVCFVSHQNMKLLENQLGETLPNATIVWNPYNVSSQSTQVWPPGNGVWKLACVARLEPASKGQDLLFQVLAQPQWRERPVEVNLYGSGSCEQNLKRLANRWQLAKVYFRGHVADVEKIWAENHLLMLPSRFEGLPLALVEAMWYGRPAVVTDIGGNAEMCVDGETGFVAAAPTVKLLAETMERSWNQRKQWQVMGQAARRRAEQIIPKDPVGDFCQQLKEWGSKTLK